MGIVEKTRKIEWESDNLQFDFIRKIFDIEQELDPVSVVFLMNIARQLGTVADHAENAADSVKRLLGG